MYVLKLGDVLKTCRVQAKLSQDELAFLLNRTQACISKIENGHRLPDVYTLIEWGQRTKCEKLIIAFLHGADPQEIVRHINAK